MCTLGATIIAAAVNDAHLMTSIKRTGSSYRIIASGGAFDFVACVVSVSCGVCVSVVVVHIRFYHLLLM